MNTIRGTLMINVQYQTYKNLVLNERYYNLNLLEFTYGIAYNFNS